MRVVLFDIDGTLLSTSGAGKRALEAALLTHFGTTGPQDYRYGGKTDPQIARDLMREAGFDDAVIDARMAAVLAHYLEGLRAELAAAPDEIEVHVGVTELLDALSGGQTRSSDCSLETSLPARRPNSTLRALARSGFALALMDPTMNGATRCRRLRRRARRRCSAAQLPATRS